MVVGQVRTARIGATPPTRPVESIIGEAAASIFLRLGCDLFDASVVKSSTSRFQESEVSPISSKKSVAREEDHKNATVQPMATRASKQGQ